MVGPGIGARLDRHEAELPFGVGERAARAGKIRVQRRGVLIALVRVAARRVGLPDFDERVRNRAAILVDHASLDDDPLAERLAGVLPGEIVIGGTDRVPSVHRTAQLGERLRNDDQGFLRMPERGGAILGSVQRWVNSRRRPAESGSHASNLGEGHALEQL